MKAIEVYRAIEDQDVAKVAEILEMFDFRKDGTSPRFTSKHRSIMTMMLGAASAVAAGSSTGHLDYNFGSELTERMAMVVDIFQFLKLASTAMKLGNDNYNTIPDLVRLALTKNEPSYAVNRAIDNMSPDAFEAMVSMVLSKEIAELSISFSAPIIRYVYENQVLPDELMFAFMAACSIRTNEEIFFSEAPFDILAMLDFDGSEADNDKTGKKDDASSVKTAEEPRENPSGGGWVL